MKNSIPLFLLAAIIFPLSAFAQILGGPYPRFGQYRIPAGVSSEDYVKDRIYLKIKPAYRSACFSNRIEIPLLEQIFEALDVSKIGKVFPFSPPPERQNDALGRKLVDVSTIYELVYDRDYDMESAINHLLMCGAVEYAEPHYKYAPQGGGCVPSDANLVDQYYLDLISAYDAWCVSQGDTSIVIGIVDTGTSFWHYELNTTRAYNYGDTVDGVDNDGDGYIDNFQGWDFAGDDWTSGGDNDPTFSGSDHGVTVTGVLSARPDNDTCYAGVGYHCRQVMFKTVVNGSGSIIKGYEAVVYAADHDIPIINCSWGGTTPTKFGQDAVDYAVINKGCMVVVAAGNSHQELYPFYPASYHNAVSTAGTQAADSIWLSFSTYGTTYNPLVDICAPARGVATLTSHSFCTAVDAISGTSLAAPMVCGAAGLAKAIFPGETMAQIQQRVRTSADNIYPGFGSSYGEKMGYGRLNAYRALTDTSPSVRIVEVKFNDHDDQVLEAGDTLDLYVKFANYLQPVSALTISLTADPAHAEVLEGNLEVGELDTYDTLSTLHFPFRIVLNDTALPDTRAYLRFGYSDAPTGYEDWEYIDLRISESSVFLDANLVETSMDGSGNLGWTDAGIGRGFYYNGEKNYLSEGGLLIGTSADKVSNCIHNETGANDAHFVNLVPATRQIPGALADLQAHAVYNDDSAGLFALGTEIEHNAYQYCYGSDSNYVIHEYVIINRGGDTLKDAYAGLYADWDLGNWGTNFTRYDSTGELVYAFEPGLTSLNYVGMGPITTDTFHAYSAVIPDFGYTKADKWAALTSPLDSANSDTADIMSMVSQGPFSIAPGDTHTLAFFMLGGENISEMQATAEAARDKYWCVIRGAMEKVHLGEDQVFCGDTSLALEAGGEYESYTWNTGETTSGITVDSSGTYIVEVTDTNGCTDHSKVEITIAPAIAAGFEILDTAIFIGDTVWFVDTTSPEVIGRIWDFGDDSTGSIHPEVSHVFTTPGLHTITLRVNNCVCEATVSQTISVDTMVARAERGLPGTLKVYPNPSQGWVNLELQSSYTGEIRLEVRDILGQKIESYSVLKPNEQWQTQLNLGELPSGIYFLEVRAGEASEVFKVMLE